MLDAYVLLLPLNLGTKGTNMACTQLEYSPRSEERKLLKEAIANLEANPVEIPSIINGKRLRTGRVSQQVNPWNHAKPLATYHEVDSETVDKVAIPGALEARKTWSEMPFSHRAAIYKRAARLVETKYRWQLMAATMLGQGKTVGQAEGDCIAEVVDTLNFHVYFCHQMYQQQPLQSDSAFNSIDYRALEGFLVAISPFNFTALGAHIAYTPALVGNVVLWKPSPMAVLSNYILYQVFEEAGMPSGVVQFLPVADPLAVVTPAVGHHHFGGLHYTGSSAVLRGLCAQIGANTPNYRSIPRIVGESGGKNFHLVHNSCAPADAEWLASAAIKSAFEFQGQKCSALSRFFVPQSLWDQGDLKKALLVEAAKMTHGSDPKELHHPLGPVVSKSSFDRFNGFLETAANEGHKVLFGGKTDGTRGFFVQPTILEVNPSDKTAQGHVMTKELFGPLFAVQTYNDSTAEGFANVCELIDGTTEYGLTGSVFARDRDAVRLADAKLRDSVGMFVINDKCTGAVIGAHPFGGARGSGTNDKANSINALLRFSSLRVIKDSFESSSSTLGTCHVPE